MANWLTLKHVIKIYIHIFIYFFVYACEREWLLCECVCVWETWLCTWVTKCAENYLFLSAYSVISIRMLYFTLFLLRQQYAHQEWRKQWTKKVCHTINTYTYTNTRAAVNEKENKNRCTLTKHIIVIAKEKKKVQLCSVSTLF